MKQQKCFLYAYAAGLIDGEGCIQIVKEKPCKGRPRPSNYYYTRVSVSMNDEEGVMLLHGVFGGSLKRQHRVTSFGGGYMWDWIIQSKKALEALKHLYPFLRVKKMQAEVAMRLQGRVTNHQTRRSVSPDELAWREEQFKLIKQLRQEASLRAAVETKRTDSSEKRGSDSPRRSERKLRIA